MNKSFYSFQNDDQIAGSALSSRVGQVSGNTDISLGLIQLQMYDKRNGMSADKHITFTTSS